MHKRRAFWRNLTRATANDAMRVGVIGGGQLGRMMGLAGLPLGLDFVFLDPADAPCAAAVGKHICAPFDDSSAIRSLAQQCDVLTFEFENASADSLFSSSNVPVWPGKSALLAAQERAVEKSLFERSGIPVAPWRSVDSQQELDRAIEDLGFPLIAKTRRLGYDGKGQQRIRAREDADALFDAMGGVGLLVERLVSFDMELSVIGARSANGDLVVYPLTRNEHRHGILHRSQTVRVARELQRQAVRHLRTLTMALDYVGVIAIEFFATKDLLLGNEFAPRVHNSGHWTQDGAPYSQFENHLRAVCGLPLGRLDSHLHSGMLNLIGRMPQASEVLSLPNTFLHDYAKAPRAGRKLGHINCTAKDESHISPALDALERALGESPGAA
ncbi:MAG: 5-(carboxyamino)imidazole ribonucleotide synthase [Pseudomonadota bacterium]